METVSAEVDKDVLISALLEYICEDKPEVCRKLKDYLTRQKVIKENIDIDFLDERQRYLEVLRKNMDACQLTPFNSLTTSRYHTDFHEVNKISQGGFGTVYKAIHKLDNVTYAIKKIPVKEDFTPDDLSNINEVKILAKVNHPHVIRYYTTWIEFGLVDKESFNDSSMSSDSVLSFSELSPSDQMVVYKEVAKKSVGKYSSIIYIQMELCVTTLKEYLHEFRPNNNIKYKIIVDILLAVNYLHSNGIIHNDLSLRNILIDNEQNAKLCDFGLADLLDDQEFIIKDKKYGNTLYLAPEVRKHGKFSRASDVYSLGIIFTEIYKNYTTEMERICELSKLKNGERINEIIKDEQFSKIISLMLQNSAKYRPTTAILLRNLNTN